VWHTISAHDSAGLPLSPIETGEKYGRQAGKVFSEGYTEVYSIERSLREFDGVLVLCFAIWKDGYALLVLLAGSGGYERAVILFYATRRVGCIMYGAYWRQAAMRRAIYAVMRC